MEINGYYLKNINKIFRYMLKKPYPTNQRMFNKWYKKYISETGKK